MGIDDERSPRLRLKAHAYGKGNFEILVEDEDGRRAPTLKLQVDTMMEMFLNFRLDNRAL